MATDTRERILNALRRLLAAGGTSITLEAVAASAGVSKGGLLYHFPSKAALYLGLLQSVRDSVVIDMAAATERFGAARGFLEYAEPTEEDEAEFFTSLIAAVRTSRPADPGQPTASRQPAASREPAAAAQDTATGEHDAQASALLVDIFRAWEEPMRAAVADPVQAETIRLVGFGLYFAALTGLPPVDPAVLAQLFDRLVRGT